VNKAVSYLENGESVTEASMKSGFADINTFIRNFKKYKGLVPSKY
jgi:AraC-like DNA-binding protein